MDNAEGITYNCGAAMWNIVEDRVENKPGLLVMTLEGDGTH